MGLLMGLLLVSPVLTMEADKLKVLILNYVMGLLCRSRNFFPV
jgi:hypothetical protein